MPQESRVGWLSGYGLRAVTYIAMFHTFPFALGVAQEGGAVKVMNRGISEGTCLLVSSGYA